MRKTLLIIFGLILFEANEYLLQGIAAAQSISTGAISKSKDLVLVGKVTKIYPVAKSHSLRNWAIIVQVVSMESGELTAANLTFTVHSPAQAGLRIGRVYRIKATSTDGGYVVDEIVLEEVGARK
jgi:hypothetical protein